jgi:hypothetical protein
MLQPEENPQQSGDGGILSVSSRFDASSGLKFLRSSPGDGCCVQSLRGLETGKARTRPPVET